MGIEISPRITQKGDKDSLGPTSKYPFAFKRGINATRRKGHSFQHGLHALAFFLSPKKSACTNCIPSCMHHL
jgi:hypothetical protein